MIWGLDGPLCGSACSILVLEQRPALSFRLVFPDILVRRAEGERGSQLFPPMHENLYDLLVKNVDLLAFLECQSE